MNHPSFPAIFAKMRTLKPYILQRAMISGLNPLPLAITHEWVSYLVLSIDEVER